MTSPSQEGLRRRKYRNPPIAEAIARLAWGDEWKWNVTTPGLLYDRLRDLYPEEPQAQGAFQANFQPGAPRGSTTLEVVSSGADKMLFSQADGSRLLGVSPRDISAHGLAPYEGWEALESRLFEGFERIRSLAPMPRFSTLGLRFVNRIEIPQDNVRFEDFLTITLGLPDGFPRQIFGFFDRTESRYPDERTTIALTWASTDGPPGMSTFVLDLDLYHHPEEPLSLDEARRELGEMKAKEGQAFEGLLQDRLREMFGEVHD